MFSFSVIGTIASALANAVTIPNPLAWFKMNERAANTVVDSSGNGYDGTNNGATVNATGKVLDSNSVARGYNFDGVNDSISIADNSAFSFGNGSTDSPFSISAWIYADTLTTNFPILSRYMDVNANTGEYTFIVQTTGKVSLALIDSAVANRETRISDTVLSTGQWYHVVGTYDGTGGSSASSGIEIYINGVKESTYTSADAGTYVAMENLALTTRIGSQLENYTTPQYADGKIDQVVLHNAELSQSEIDEIYNSGSGLKYADWSSALQAKTVAVYELDELATNVVEDFSGNAYHGTNNGASVEATAPNSGLVYAYSLTTNDYIEQTTLTFGDTDYTISAWVKLDNKTNPQVVFSKGANILGGQLYGIEFTLQYNTSSDKFRFIISDQSSIQTIDGTTTPSAGTWYYVVVIHSATGNTIRLYVNGSEENSAATTVTPSSSTANFQVGGYASGGGNQRFLEGDVDNVKIYNTALSATQVLAEYNSQNGGTE